MIKKLLALSVGLFICNAASADEVIFSCETNKGNFITVKDNNGIFEYAISNKGSAKQPDFSFQTKDVQTADQKDKLGVFRTTGLKNNGYTYVIVKLILDNSQAVPMGVLAFDPNGKKVSTQECKNAISEVDSFLKSQEIQQPKQSNLNIVEGMYRVGKDIPAGEYKLTATNEIGASFKVYSSSEHTYDSLVAFETFKNSTYLTVKEGQYLQLRNATAQLVE